MGIVFLGVLPLCLASCGTDDSQNANTSRQAQGPTAKDERPAPMPEPPSDDERIAAAVKRELRTQFGPNGLDAPWYDVIGRVTAGGGDVTVETSLNRVAFDGGSDSDAEGPANAICTVIGPDNFSEIKGLTGGRILGSDGGVVKRC
jgi:hypothetical protein